MIVATRQLMLKCDGEELPVMVSIHAPIKGDRCWDCDVEIGWPEGGRKIRVSAFDSMQAIYLAMQRVALELYVSSHHAAGNLRWDKPANGYGFPMAKSGYSDLVGFDRESQVP
jgi:hypothetical protein